MKYLGAVMLAILGGKTSPTADDIKTILNSAGVEFEEETLSKVISEIEGKDVNALIEEGMGKLSSVPAAGAPAAAGAAPAGGEAEAPKEEEKEESEEEEEDMDFDLFD